MPKNAPIQEKNKGKHIDPGVRHPEGCPINGHQGYGCACNPVPAKRWTFPKIAGPGNKNPARDRK